MNNQLNEVFSTFNSLNSILHLGCRLIDIFFGYIVFHNADCSSNENKISYCKKLDKIILEFLSDPRTVVIISNMSIKNNVAFSISHIHSFNNLLKKHFIMLSTSYQQRLNYLPLDVALVRQFKYNLSHIS